MKWPAYRYSVLDGIIRQDVPNGRWVALEPWECDALLARFDGMQVQQPGAVPVVDSRPARDAASTFHHVV